MSDTEWNLTGHTCCDNGNFGEPHECLKSADAEPSAPASAEPSNAPTTREWLVAQLAKSRDWGYGALSIEGVTKLLDAYTADLRAKLEQVERDLLERTTQRNLARDAREVWSKRAETAESALADAQARIRVLEGERDAALKDAKSWKHEFEMYRNALLGSMWSHHPLPLIYCPACVKRMEEEQLEARHE